MSKLFEELDYCPTPIGAISLRRRYDFHLKKEVYEIKLGEEFLMSSSFTASEIALANLGLDALQTKDPNVLVGGLGLGYTAEAVLAYDNVNSLIVVDALQPVIDWHNNAMLPLGKNLTSDPRCKFLHGDFFALVKANDGFTLDNTPTKFDCILVDIDHSPEALLDEGNASFYRPQGLMKLKQHMNPGAIFGLWSNDAPDESFTKRLEGVFGFAKASPVIFHNPIQNRKATQTVYLASDTNIDSKQEK